MVTGTTSLRRALLIGILAALAACGACQHPTGAPISGVPRAAATQPAADGVVYLFPGIEGGNLSLIAARRGILDAGIKSDVRICEWGVPLGGINNLVSYDRNRREAKRFAAQIAEYRRQNPAAPIQLVGYSGGGGMAVMVAEALLDELRIQNIVLVQPALSPDYDLSRALAHVDGKIVNFHSTHDAIVLGAGTQTFGNMDGKHDVAAGKDGFRLDAAVRDPALRSRVTQVSWTPDMLVSGHFGGHLGILTYGWNRQYVAPRLAAQGG